MSNNKIACVIHELFQGSPEWQQFRLTHYGASEAAVMLGLSKNATRSELLRMKYLGDAKEFCRWVQENILDHGHAVEALARPITEAEIDDDLYPVTCSAELMPAWASYEMSSSCDGLTLSRRTAWEHKQWNEALAASVAVGVLPDEHMPQCQQIMMVTGAEKVIFTVSDGTAEKRVSMEVFPDAEWQERIYNGWCQFDKDLAAYQLPEAEKVLAAEPVLALPAVAVQVSGQIAITENFKAFEVALRSFLENDLIREPKTDQDFVDLDSQIKEMKKAETALDAAEAQMLAQITSVDDAKRQKDLLAKLVRENRLMAEKLLASEKDRRRAEMIETARKAFTAHLAALQAEIAGLRLNVGAPDFAGAIKGLKTISSMQEKLDVALANGKIAADQQAADLRAKLTWVKEHAEEHRALLADLQQLAAKPMDDFTLAITVRIDNHKKAEAARLEAEREAIRKEEADKLAAQQAQALEAEQKKAAASVPVPAAAVESSAQLPLASAASPARSIPVERTYVSSTPRLLAGGPPTLRLGQINERLAPINLTADGLAGLGFVHAATDKAAKLYHEHDYPLMCAALIEHLRAAQHTGTAQAA
ncbi:YqaJ viral recombinase family protein [Herbaspirillum sp. YR522]|uniref:YqaJ viral recombinase family protein n=1 Tax=Herbaspirillum sp. YR522 TaxID=1144342 RepID=UPI00026FA294|nr:YqaJ viral recombinase family protein [Herbaspirillum sp. YR522]EJN06454.1 YqaJ viral recombinase family protein [Herbaspirillum sp. YR522]